MNDISNNSQLSQLEIIDLTLKNIDELAIKKIYKKISKFDKGTVAINLMGVETCVTKFFEMFRRKKGEKLILVNVDSKILATMYMTGYDKYVRIFEDSISLLSDKNEIINRRFTLV